MIDIRNIETGEVQTVGSLKLYGPEWIQVTREANAETGWLVYDEEADQASMDLASLRARAWDRLKAARSIKMAVAQTPWGPFDADADGKANITGMATSLLLLGDAAPATIAWRLHDNTTATLARADFLTASLLVSEHVASVYATSWALQEQLAAATTVAEIKEVQWPAA